MSEPKWTKGPWSLGEMWRPPVGNIDVETDANGNIFWGYSITGRCEKGASILPTLAAVHNFPEQVEANAHLIASAPELYEALEQLHDNTMEYIAINKLGGENNHDLRAARAAMAKARGETS